MTCPRCKNMAQNVRMRTRGELFKAVRVIKQAIADRDIEEIDAGPMKGVVEFKDLNEEGPLDDLLLYRFRCPDCGENFVLSAETWHGTGGSWGRAAPLNAQ